MRCRKVRSIIWLDKSERARGALSVTRTTLNGEA